MLFLFLIIILDLANDSVNIPWWLYLIIALVILGAED